MQFSLNFCNSSFGTIVIDGSAATEVRGKPQWEGSGTIEITGTKVEKRSFSQLGSGTLFAINGSSEVSGSNPPDQVVPIVISGTGAESFVPATAIGSGTFSALGGSAEVKGSNPPDQVVPIVISGTKVEKRSFSQLGSGTLFAINGSSEVSGSNPPDQVVPIVISGNARERFIPATVVGSGTIAESGVAIEKNTESDVGIGTITILGGITPDVQIYVPYWTGSGTFSALGGSAEVSGSNPPDQVVPIVISGNARERFTPATAVGSGIIELTGVGIGISNPYKAPYVYVTII